MSPLAPQASIALILLASAVSSANACIYLLGTAPNSVAHHPAGTPWDYARMGDDWEGYSVAADTNVTWKCMTGTGQSPINFNKGDQSGSKASTKLRTKMKYPPLMSNGSDVTIINNGHTIQVQWDATHFKPQAMIPFKGLKTSTVLDVLTMTPADKIYWAKAVPYQFHFHTASEHTMGGMHSDLEMHIVHNVPQSEINGCPEAGCIAVVGILLKQTEEDNPVIETIFGHASTTEGVVNPLPAGETIDMQSLLPLKGKGQYMQYSGGLTIPPCYEGFLWHVFGTPINIGRKQVMRFYELVAFKNCELKGNASDIAVAHSSDDPAFVESRRVLRDQTRDGHDHASEASSGGSFFVPSNVVLQRNTYRRDSHPPHHPQGRSLEATADHEDMHANNPSDYTCEVAAYGYNNRRNKPLHNRVIKNYASI